MCLEQGVYGFDTVWGVSAGAINAASYLSRQQGRYMRETLAFRDDSRFMGFKSLATTGDIAGADFLYHKIQDEIDPFDYETFAARRSRYMVVVSDVVFGTPKYLEVKSRRTSRRFARPRRYPSSRASSRPRAGAILMAARRIPSPWSEPLRTAHARQSLCLRRIAPTRRRAATSSRR